MNQQQQLTPDWGSITPQEIRKLIFNPFKKSVLHCFEIAFNYNIILKHS